MRIQRYTLLIASLVMLTSCADFFKHSSKHPAKTVATQKYNSSDFIEHLSIANTTLESGGSLSDIANDAKVLEAYSKQKNTKTVKHTIVILEYTDNNDKNHRVMAPVSNASLSTVSEVMDVLDNKTYKLKDIKVAAASVAPGAPIKITGQELPVAKEIIAARSQAIMVNSTKLPALQEAKLQLKLLRFFIAGQKRDAAYIAADNTKRLLLNIHDKGNAEVTELAKDLEAAEGELHQKMPY